MNKRVIWASAFVVSICCLVSLPVFAEDRAVVFTLKAVNIEQGVVDATSITIASEIESHGYTIVDHSAALHQLWQESIDSKEQAKKPEAPLVPKEPEASAEPLVPPPPPPGEENTAAIEPAVPEEPEPGPEPDELEPQTVPLVPISQDALHLAVAEELGVDYYFDGSLVRLGKQMQVRVAMHTREGNIVATKRMAARTEDDLPIVIPRLVEALLQQKDTEETRNLDNATRAETENQPQRFKLEKNFGLIIGQAFGFGDMRSVTQLTFDGRFEFGNVLAEIDAGLALATKEFSPQFVFDIAVGYYLSRTSVAPYIGGGAGLFVGERMNEHCEHYTDVDYDYEYEECSADSFVGWNLFPFIGLEMLRQSSIRLHIDFRYLFNFSGDAFGHAPMVLAGINF